MRLHEGGRESTLPWGWGSLCGEGNGALAPPPRERLTTQHCAPLGIAVTTDRLAPPQAVLKGEDHTLSIFCVRHL